LRFWPPVLIPRRLMGSLVLLLRCAVLGRRGLLALLLPVAELILIVPGLGRVSFLHGRRRLGLRMRPALRPIVVVLIYRGLRRTRCHLPFRTRRLDRPRGHDRLLRAGIGPGHLWADRILGRPYRLLWTRQRTIRAWIAQYRSAYLPWLLTRPLGADIDCRLPLIERLARRSRPLGLDHLAVDNRLRRPEPGRSSRA